MNGEIMNSYKIKVSENYDKGITFVIGYLSYTGCIKSLDITKWIIAYKGCCNLFGINKIRQ